MQGVRPLGKGICIGNALGDLKKYDLGYSGPMNDNGSVRGHAWRNHCKGFVHAQVKFRRK